MTHTEPIAWRSTWRTRWCENLRETLVIRFCSSLYSLFFSPKWKCGVAEHLSPADCQGECVNCFFSCLIYFCDLLLICTHSHLLLFKDELLVRTDAEVLLRSGFLSNLVRDPCDRFGLIHPLIRGSACLLAREVSEDGAKATRHHSAELWLYFWSWRYRLISSAALTSTLMSDLLMWRIY